MKWVGSVAKNVKVLFYGNRVIIRLHNLGSTPALVAHVVASLDKALYFGFELYDYGGFEQAANLVVRSQLKNLEMDNS